MQHGVSMYFGNAARPNRDHLQQAQGARPSARRRRGSPTTSAGAASTAATRTTCCRCPTRGRRSKRTARNIREVQDFLGVPVAVENVSSYAEFHVSRDDRVGIPQRSRRARRLRNPARREQHLRLLEEPRLRSVRLPRRRARASASRRSTSPATRSSSATSSIRTIIRCSIPCGSSTRTPSQRCGRTATLLEWDDRIPELRRSASRGAQGQPISARCQRRSPRNARDRLGRKSSG